MRKNLINARVSAAGTIMLAGAAFTCLGGCDGGLDGGATPSPSDSALASPLAETQRVQDFLDARYRQREVQHSFHTVFGQTIDCIDFFAQPGVKALAQRGTPLSTMPEPPPLGPKGIPSVVEFNGKLDDQGKPRACPKGTVPYVRITAQEIASVGGLAAYLASQSGRPGHSPEQSVLPTQPSPEAPISPPAPQAAVCTQQFGLDYPGYAHVQQTYNNANQNNISSDTATFSIFIPGFPSMPGGGAHMVAQTWTYSGWGANSPTLGCTCGGAGEPACTQSVETGWIVNVQTYGNQNPHFFTFSTNDGYHTSCWGGTACTSPAPIWVGYSGALMAPGTILTNGSILGTQHELYVNTVNLGLGNPVGSAGYGWWIIAGVDGSRSAMGYFPGTAYTGSMPTKAQTFQVGGEVHDPNSAWGVPMGSGANPSAGYTQAAAVHDFGACGTSACYSPMAGGMITTVGSNYSYSTSAAGASGWQNWFYYGNVPNVFWGQNHGYQWTPVGDWSYGNYKGECGMNGASKGIPLVGLSAYTGGSHQAHAVQCAATTVSTTGSSCYARMFDPNNNQGLAGDWDVGFYKANCAANEYVQGVSQSTAGRINGILCCPSIQATHNYCTTEVLYNQNSSSFYTNGTVDWDWGFDKGQCSYGKYVAGVSANYSSSQGVVGAPHAIECCSLN
jgi:hypothetical protein